jgi:hypothetical protein
MRLRAYNIGGRHRNIWPESLKVIPPVRAKGICHDLTKTELTGISDENLD